MFVTCVRVALVPSFLMFGAVALRAEEWREPYPEAPQPERYYSEPAYAEPAYAEPAYAEPRYAPAEPQRYVEPAAPAAAPVAVRRKPTAPLSAEFIALANEAPLSGNLAKSDKPDPQVVKLQVLLDRVHVSPGAIDGRSGGNLNKAISALQSMHSLPASGRLGPDIWDILQAASERPVLMDYTISDKDVAGPFVPVMPKDYAEMAALPKLAYRDPAELLAEKFHMDENFLRNLNPDADFSQAGTIITVTDVGSNARARVAHLVADASTRQLLGYNEN
ncbi:MAG: peptidoglycan-binding protein, partial [Rhizobiales bacterium]|nr:peptidoglycan-binding protein [Hyphomicrobiales bacterium]